MNLALERFCKDVEGLVEKYYPKRDQKKEVKEKVMELIKLYNSEGKAS